MLHLQTWLSFSEGRMSWRCRRCRCHRALEHGVENFRPEDGETADHYGQNDQRFPSRQFSHVGAALVRLREFHCNSTEVSTAFSKELVSTMQNKLFATTPSASGSGVASISADWFPTSPAHDYIQARRSGSPPSSSSLPSPSLQLPPSSLPCVRKRRSLLRNHRYKYTRFAHAYAYQKSIFIYFLFYVSEVLHSFINY